jgi:hypothetical protein
MGATPQPVPTAPPETPAPPAVPGKRNWYIDEIVVVAFAVFGVAGAVFLPLHYSIPPIITAYLLATGLAALAYRFLGGIQGSSIAVGVVKLGGSLGALAAVATLINSALVNQLPKPYEVWQVSGEVVDEAGKPWASFDPGDIAIQPSVVYTGIAGDYRVTITSSPDINGNQQFPKLSIGHADYSSDAIDLNPGSQNDVSVTRNGQSLVIGRVQLHKLATYSPSQPLQPVAAGLEAPPLATSTATPEPHQ